MWNIGFGSRARSSQNPGEQYSHLTFKQQEVWIVYIKAEITFNNFGSSEFLLIAS